MPSTLGVPVGSRQHLRASAVALARLCTKRLSSSAAATMRAPTCGAWVWCCTSSGPSAFLFGLPSRRRGVPAWTTCTGQCSRYGWHTRPIRVQCIKKQGVVDYEGDCWQRDLSPQGLRFVKALLSRDPSQRPTAAAALQHPWLTDLQPIRPPIKHAVEEAGVVESTTEVSTKATKQREGGKDSSRDGSREGSKEGKSTFRRMQITWSWS